jgi:hypothetical protein
MNDAYCIGRVLNAKDEVAYEGIKFNLKVRSSENPHCKVNLSGKEYRGSPDITIVLMTDKNPYLPYCPELVEQPLKLESVIKGLRYEFVLEELQTLEYDESTNEEPKDDFGKRYKGYFKTLEIKVRDA